MRLSLVWAKNYEDPQIIHLHLSSEVTPNDMLSPPAAQLRLSDTQTILDQHDLSFFVSPDAWGEKKHLGIIYIESNTNATYLSKK